MLIMKPLSPLSQDVVNEHQAQRAAARHGLFFHIDLWGVLHLHDGEDTERDATEPERVMWRSLVGEIEPGRVLDALPSEFERSLTGRGPCYISPEDFAVLRSDPAFAPNTDRAQLMAGFFGVYKEKTPLYVSRAVPKGYYLDADRVVPELNWRPGDAMTRETAPELDEVLRCELEVNLQPLLG